MFIKKYFRNVSVSVHFLQLRIIIHVIFRLFNFPQLNVQHHIHDVSLNFDLVVRTQFLHGVGDSFEKRIYFVSPIRGRLIRSIYDLLKVFRSHEIFLHRFHNFHTGRSLFVPIPFGGVRLTQIRNEKGHGLSVSPTFFWPRIRFKYCIPVTHFFHQSVPKALPTISDHFDWNKANVTKYIGLRQVLYC